MTNPTEADAERARDVLKCWSIDMQPGDNLGMFPGVVNAVADALSAARAEGIAQGIAAAEEANRLHNGLTGLVKMKADERAGHVLHQYFDGLTIRAENREGAKDYLSKHFSFVMADGIAQGRAEMREIDALVIEAARAYCDKIGLPRGNSPWLQAIIDALAARDRALTESESG